MSVTKKILDDTFSKTIKDTISEVVEKTIKEGVNSSTETTLKRVVNDSINNVLQKNMNDLLSNNLDALYKTKFDDLLSDSTNIGRTNLNNIVEDFSTSLSKNNPELIKTMLFKNRENFGSEFTSLVQRNINQTIPPGKLANIRSSFLNSPDGKAKLINDLDSIPINVTGKSETELRSILDDTIKTNKGTKDTLDTAYNKMKDFMANNKALFFKIIGVVGLIGAIPLMSLIFDQLLDKDDVVMNVTNIKKINTNTLKITVNFSKPIKFCPDDKIKVISFTGVTPNINNTEYNLDIDTKIDDKNYILILNSTPNITSVADGAKGTIITTYGFYDQLGCNLVKTNSPDDDSPDDDSPDDDLPDDDLPDDESPSDNKSSNKNIIPIIVSIFIVIIIIIIIFMIKK